MGKPSELTGIKGSDMEPLTIRLIQTTLHWQDPEANRSDLEKLMMRDGGDPQLIILPETFTTGFLGDNDDIVEGPGGPTLDWMRKNAARTGGAVCGSVVIRENGKLFNRFMIVTEEGLQAKYDKRHLFGYGGENERYTPGSERVVFSYRGWRFCPQICYDLRFPVWNRNRNDYDCLLYVANWPALRADAWSSLLKARAIENQCYLIAVNRVGEDGNGVPFSGRSIVHDPLGESLNVPDDAVSVIDVTLDPEHLNTIRMTLAFQKDADDFELKEV
jgi:predicted amidohydrolase